ncbi:MAG TPA: ABC transporter substrate-binding protein [Acidimicrobiia bacterium]|nr:ABC transporter substrate-binding protein [Acidimicrobiia bacterium]
MHSPGFLRHNRPDRRRGTVVVAGVAVVAFLFAACGSGSTAKTGSATTTTSNGKPPGGGSTTPAVKTLGVGVTATSIKVGVSLLDYACVEAFTNSLRFGQPAIYQTFIDYVNQQGGIAGRKIVPVYKLFCPIGTATVLAACTSLTEDSQVFAVMGTFYDPSGDGQTCVAGQHHRVLLTFDLTQAIMNKSPAGLIVNAGSNPERLVRVLLELLARRGTLQGRTVGVLGDTAGAATVNGTILPGLKKLGVTVRATGLLTITGSDTTAAQSQLDSFIERWKTEHVDTIFLSGYPASSIQFVTKLRKELPNLLLLSDNGQVLGEAQQLKRSGVTPNPYEGLITAGGQTQNEYATSANWTYCKTIYKKETGKDAPGANDRIPYKDSKTQTLDTYGAINDACQLVSMFHDIAARVGPYLNNTNWVNTVSTYGPITNRGSGPYSSLHAGKYDAEDNWRLEQFDSSLPPDGQFRPITPLQDIAG